MNYMGDIILGLISVPVFLWIEYGIGYIIGGYTGAKVLIQIDMAWRILFTVAVVFGAGEVLGGLYYATLFELLPAMIGWVYFMDRIKQKKAKKIEREEQDRVHVELEKTLLKKLNGNIKI